jgi:hypothetical protein
MVERGQKGISAIHVMVKAMAAISTETKMETEIVSKYVAFPNSETCL